MKNISFINFVLILVLSSLAHAKVVTSTDYENQCTVYRALSEEKPMLANERLWIDSPIYGFSLHNAKVDFDKKQVSLNIKIRIVLGFDYNLTKKPVIIQATNPRLDEMLNELNRTVQLFEKVCVSKANELVYARFFERESTQQRGR